MIYLWTAHNGLCISNHSKQMTMCWPYDPKELNSSPSGPHAWRHSVLHFDFYYWNVSNFHFGRNYVICEPKWWLTELGSYNLQRKISLLVCTLNVTNDLSFQTKNDRRSCKRNLCSYLRSLKNYCSFKYFSVFDWLKSPG